MKERFDNPLMATAAVAAIIFLVAGALLALGACSSQSPTPATVAPGAEGVSTSRPDATDERATSPTPMPMATLTATPSPIPGATDAPPPTLEPGATPDGPATVMAIAAPTRQASVASPDGRWQVELVVYPCSELPGGGDVLAYERLNVVESTSGAATKVADQLISCGGLGAFGLEALFWSDNARFLYFTTAREGFPDGCGYWTRPLLRFSVETGENEWLGSGVRSRDGTMVAAWQERDLVIWETGGGELGRAPAAVSDADLGAIAWSPDGAALVYLQAPSYCPLEKSYVVHVTVAEMAPSVLLEAEAPAFGDVTWMNAGRLRLVDGEGEEWIYDFASEALNPAR